MTVSVKRILFIIGLLGLYTVIGLLAPGGAEIQRLLGCFAIGWAIADISRHIFKN